MTTTLILRRCISLFRGPCSLLRTRCQLRSLCARLGLGVFVSVFFQPCSRSPHPDDLLFADGCLKRNTHNKCEKQRRETRVANTTKISFFIPLFVYTHQLCILVLPLFTTSPFAVLPNHHFVPSIPLALVAHLVTPHQSLIPFLLLLPQVLFQWPLVLSVCLLRLVSYRLCLPVPFAVSAMISLKYAPSFTPPLTLQIPFCPEYHSSC